MLLHVILSVERLVTPKAGDGARVDMLSPDVTNQHTFATERAVVLAAYPVAFKRAVVIPNILSMPVSYVRVVVLLLFVGSWTPMVSLGCRHVAVLGWRWFFHRGGRVQRWDPNHAFG